MPLKKIYSLPFFPLKRMAQSARYRQMYHIPKMSSHNAVAMSTAFSPQEITYEKIPPVKEKIIKARFTRVNDEEKKHLPGSTCLFYVSIGNALCVGENMAAILELVDSYDFKELNIVVCDTLQLQTRQIFHPDISIKQIYNQLLQEGNNWIMTHAPLFTNMKNTRTLLTKWSDHINTPGFDKYFNTVKADYESNAEFRNAIKMNIDVFMQRRKITPTSQEIKFCEDYLLTEVAEYIMTDDKPDYQIFIDKRTSALTAAYDLYIGPNCDRMRPLAMRFKPYRVDTANINKEPAINGLSYRESNFYSH